MEELVVRMAADLTALGVRAGGVLLVHSSLRALGPLPDRAEATVRALLRALGDDGTLLMPALSYRTVSAQQPVFDVRHAPSCVGALSEYFRTRPSTIRSVHPTHSVSGTGARAAALLGEHGRDVTPVGPHSPFRKLRDAGPEGASGSGQVLFLGCGLRPNTSMHGVEELAEPPYLYAGDVDYRIVLRDGRETTMRVRSHSFEGWEQRYDRLGPLLAERGRGLTTGTVLSAQAHLVDAVALWETALAALRANPLYFVDKADD
jgi:aminoglycoside 3-N-acetyltransferase